jgi:hypothetical protein
MMENKVNKEEFLAIKSEITEDGIAINIKGKRHSIKYPKEVWQGYSEVNKELLLDNLAFMLTCHLPAANNKKGAVYSTALPLFETSAFKCTLYDIPSTAVLAKQKTTEYLKKFFNSTFAFASYDTVMPDKKERKSGQKKKPSALILFTSGKESLLTLGLCLELGIKPIPVFIDEYPDSPESRHKEKIIEKIEREYGIKVLNITNDLGELRLNDLEGKKSRWGWGTQFLSYTLEVMPFVQHFDADYLFFGNEYDCDGYIYDEDGFESSFCFDQRAEWTRQLDIVAKTMTNGSLEVGSIVGNLWEFGLMKVLHSRYPYLGKLQMSCTSDTEEGKDSIWCGNCSKCGRMFAFFKALGIDTQKMGFKDNMFDVRYRQHFSLLSKEGMYGYDSSGIGAEVQATAFFMAAERGEKGELIEEFKKMPLYNQIKANIKKKQAEYFSQYENIAVPYDLKEKLMDIFEETFKGDFVPKDFRLKQYQEAENTQEERTVVEEKDHSL